MGGLLQRHTIAGAGRVHLLRRLVHQAPHALHEAVRGIDAAVRPLDVALGRGVGQHEPARGVGAVVGDDRIRVDDVLLRLRHRLDGSDRDRRAGPGVAGLSVLQDHVLGKDPGAGLVLVGLVRDHALGEEALERLRPLSRSRTWPPRA